MLLMMFSFSKINFFCEGTLLCVNHFSSLIDINEHVLKMC